MLFFTSLSVRCLPYARKSHHWRSKSTRRDICHASPKVALVSAPGKQLRGEACERWAAVLQGKLSAPSELIRIPVTPCRPQTSLVDRREPTISRLRAWDAAGHSRLATCLQSRFLSRDARLLWTTLRNSGRHGSRVCRLQTSCLSSERRISRVSGKQDRAPTLADGTTPATMAATW